MLSDVAAPAQVPGLLGSHAVHSQKPKVPTLAVGVNTTRLEFPVTSDPKLSAALRQQAFEFPRMVDVCLGLVINLGPTGHRNIPANSAVLLLAGDALHRPPSRLGPDAFAARGSGGRGACRLCRSRHSANDVQVHTRHEDLVGVLANPEPSHGYRARGHVCGKVDSLWEPLAGLPMVNLIRRIPVCMDISPVIDGPGPEALLRLGFGVWAVVEDGISVVISI